MASVRQAFYLVARISSHDFPLASEERDTAPVNHPALVKTSDQPSFSSVNFSPFTSAETLIIRYQSYAKPEPTAKSSWWNSKENEFTLQKYIEATQKEKIKQTTKSKTNRLASNALLGPSKRRKRRVCRDPAPSDTPSHSDIDLVVLFTDDSTEEKKNKTLIVCTVLVVSLKTTMEKSGYDVRNISDGRTHFVLVWRKVLFLSFVRDKHCFVLSLYPLYLIFFAFCK